MKKNLLWVALLLPMFMNSCKDELADSIKVEMKEADTKVEKVTPVKSASIDPGKRKDKDWETSVGN